jgi:hypothetical protein
MMMEANTVENLPKGRRLVMTLAGFFCLFSGLCTVFLLVATAALAWQDRVHAQWPEARAQVEQCGLDPYEPDPKYYRIDCSVSYIARGEEIISHVYSRTAPDPRRVIWESQPPQFERMQDWVDAHPKGTPIAVHYDPASHSKAVLAVTDMPLGASQTSFCLRMLEITAVSCLVLLAIVRKIRPRPIAVNQGN